MAKKTIKGEGWYYAILCRELICGVSGTKDEAADVLKKIEGCPGVKSHKIRRCKVSISY